MPWPFPRYICLWIFGFENGPSMFLIRPKRTGSSRHPNRITLIIIPTPTIEHIVVRPLLHKPLPLNNPILPTLIILEQQRRRTTHTLPISRQLYRIDQTWIPMSITIDLINEVLDISGVEDSGVYYSFGGVGDNGGAFVGVGAQDVGGLGDADGETTGRGVSGRVVDGEDAVYYVELGGPVVAAAGPGGAGWKDPAHLGEVGTGGALPDWEVMLVPALCGDGVVGAVVVEDAWIRGVPSTLHWVDVGQYN